MFIVIIGASSTINSLDNPESNANEYLKKLECFCFEEQFLAPGEEALLPVRFIFDSNMPESINNVALSYTIFDITNYNDMEMAHHDGR